MTSELADNQAIPAPCASLATTPVEELLGLPMLQPAQTKDSIHAYQISKRGNSCKRTFRRRSAASTPSNRGENYDLFPVFDLRSGVGATESSSIDLCSPMLLGETGGFGLPGSFLNSSFGMTNVLSTATESDNTPVLGRRAKIGLLVEINNQSAYA